jgi:hypothetical protein
MAAKDEHIQWPKVREKEPCKWQHHRDTHGCAPVHLPPPPFLTRRAYASESQWLTAGRARENEVRKRKLTVQTSLAAGVRCG